MPELAVAITQLGEKFGVFQNIQPQSSCRLEDDSSDTQIIGHKLCLFFSIQQMRNYPTLSGHLGKAVGEGKEEEVRGERTKSGAEIMTSQDGCRCEL